MDNPVIKTAAVQTLPDEPARLEVDQIKVSYNGHLALDDLTFQVAHGARLAVVGPNAAGKTTDNGIPVRCLLDRYRHAGKVP